MRSHLSINDTEPTIGEARLTVENPLAYVPTKPPAEPSRAMQPLELFYVLSDRIQALEARIVELEARTWWSMLKDQLRAIWRRNGRTE